MKELQTASTNSNNKVLPFEKSAAALDSKVLFSYVNSLPETIKTTDSSENSHGKKI